LNPQVNVSRPSGANRYQAPSMRMGRSQFDLTHSHKMTFEVGYLYPYFMAEVIPGDTMTCNLRSLVRIFSPLDAPLMDDVFIGIDFFYVPYRLVWSHWDDFLGAHDAAGAQDLLNKARLVREQRISALEKNTGSPFLSQASLTGMNNAVEAQASARERSYLDEYAAVLDQVNKTASLAIGDAQRQDALKQERIMAIQKAVESEVEKRRNDLRSLYLQDYLSGKKPETITIGDSLLSYNPKTKQFEVAYTKEKAKSYEIKTLDDGSNVIFDPQTGEYEPIGSGGTVINPNGSLEIVNGYNITKYATKGTLADPNYRPGDTLHGADVAKTYSSLPLDMEGLQTYIKAKFPKSPISAQMIFDSSAKYGVDPGMVAAMMINDSSLGTAGLGAKTRNPGNVGNDDAGNTRTYSSWKDGVDAVSKWLANNKVSSQDQGVIDSSAQAFAGAKLTKDKRAAFNQGVNALKQQGKAQEAAQFIRQTAVDNLDGARKKDYDSISDVASQAKSIGSTLKNGPVLNIYQTALQSSKSLAAVSKDPEWTKLVAEVGNSMAQYRNKLFGAALTDTELAIANSFLFDINRDTAKDLEIKIKALDTFANTVKSRIESEAMGTVYDSSAKLNNINSILSQPGSGTASSTSRLPINSLLKGIGGSISSWFTR